MENLILSLNDFAAKAAKRAELFASTIVIAIVLMLILPLPNWLLDILIALNLCASGLMVVVSMYVEGPTGFSTFPSVLLITTLFRLALEVATTRRILLNADAGHIVETFGNFVVGGNLVVGLVIFLILTVVQFIVITKGSERVSEVAARFSLDGMPGRQMSIDSDLRAGLLTADEAKRKRAELINENQLHGAMDGAMKFVKGDSIAGIFIVVVNLIGGIAIGTLQIGMSAAAAMHLYSVLSIGDALIAQIPALLISLAAGMITTRVTSGDMKEEGVRSNIGRDIVTELFREPKALLTAAAIMLLFALIPGMPTLVFLMLAMLLGGAGGIGLSVPSLLTKRKNSLTQHEKNNPRVVDLMSFNATRPFMIRMPENMRDTPHAESISNAVRVMRNGILEHNGIPDLPPIDFEYSTRIADGRIQFLMAEVPLIDVEMQSGWGATTESASRVTELGFEAQEDKLIGTRRRRLWVKIQDANALNEAGVNFMPWETVFAADVKVEMLRNCQMFVGVQEALRFTRWADRRFPELGKELGKAVTLPRLADIIQRLARESVSLRNTRLLLETILEWSPKEREADTVADYVRLAMKRQLCYEVARDGLIEVVLLSPELEDQLRSAIRQTNQGSYLDLDPELEQTMLDRLSELSGTGGTPAVPPVLVTAADLRRALRK